MSTAPSAIVKIVVDRPIKEPFDYLWDKEKLLCDPQVGMMVEVPFGKTKLLGIVYEVSARSNIESSRLKAVDNVAPLLPLDKKLMQLAQFASRYYLHGLGETIIPAIPKWWRTSHNWTNLTNKLNIKKSAEDAIAKNQKVIAPEQLNDEQSAALQSLCAHPSKQFKPFYLNGVTGSGKTAVYLSYLAQILKISSDSQALIMLPEINLTPQLEKRIAAHLPNIEMAVLHSGLTEKQRAVAWYRVMTGRARIILGTRLSIMTPIPFLAAIVVDEENDSSFKQQEGLSYSARDLAIWRAKNEQLPIVLASATPSAQTWFATKEGRYQELQLTKRIHGFQMPQLYLQPPEKLQPLPTIDSKLVEALRDNLNKGRQALVFINRRGLAPTLTCLSCGWLSECMHCSGYMVIHRQLAQYKSSMLCCHHCGLLKPPPTMCPNCGDADLQPLGRGTQKIEDQLQAQIPGINILRVDADSASTSKKSKELFNQIHEGDAQIIVGTQMLAKGHDYQNIGLVCVLDSDARLYSSDYRAPENLFAQLIQVAGRAGRYGGEQAKILIETRYPNDPVYQYLKDYDVNGYMKHLMNERKNAGLPPFRYHALVHAEAKLKNVALQHLQAAKEFLRKAWADKVGVTIFDPVPKAMARKGGQERAQLLIEADNRIQLQALLDELDLYLRDRSVGRITKVGKVRWSIERDPILI